METVVRAGFSSPHWEGRFLDETTTGRGRTGADAGRTGFSSTPLGREVFRRDDDGTMPDGGPMLDEHYGLSAHLRGTGRCKNSCGRE